jgi:hypothetical protein
MNTRGLSEMAGKNNNKKRNNYFSDNIQRFGDGFIERFDAKKLRSDARRVFSDIAFGNIDFDKYWTYFTNPMFINALIDAANTKLMIHGVSYQALKEQERHAANSDTQMVMRYHERLMYAYGLFYNCFMKIKANGFQVSNTSDLKTLSNLVSQYKNDLIEPVFSSGAGVTYNQLQMFNGSNVADTYNHDSITKPIVEEEPEYVQLTLNIKDK